MIWNIPLVSLGQLSRLCSLSTSCPSPSYWLLALGRLERQPRCCASTAQQLPKHRCVINTLTTNTKHSAPRAAVGKGVSIPASTSGQAVEPRAGQDHWPGFRWMTTTVTWIPSVIQAGQMLAQMKLRWLVDVTLNDHLGQQAEVREDRSLFLK